MARRIFFLIFFSLFGLEAAWDVRLGRIELNINRRRVMDGVAGCGRRRGGSGVFPTGVDRRGEGGMDGMEFGDCAVLREEMGMGDGERERGG